MRHISHVINFAEQDFHCGKLPYMKRWWLQNKEAIANIHSMGKFTDRPLRTRDSQLLQVLWMLSGSPSGPESDVSGRAPGLCHRVLRKSVLQLLSLASYVWLHSKHKWRNFEIFSFFYCVSSHHFKKSIKKAFYPHHLVGGKPYLCLSQLFFVLGSFLEQEPGTDIIIQGFNDTREF